MSTTKRELKYVGIMILSHSAISVLALWAATSYESLVDSAVARDLAAFRSAAVFLISLIVLQVLTSAFTRQLREYSKAAVENRLKERLFSRILSKDYASVAAVHSGEWMNRLSSDTATVADGVAQIVPEVVGLTVRLVGALYLLFVLIPAFVWMLVPGSILVGLITYYFRRKLKDLYKVIRDKDGLLRIFLQEHISSLMIVHSFNREDKTLELADGRMADHKKARMKRATFSNMSQTSFAVVMNGIYVASAVYCGYLIITGQMSYGTFTAVLQIVTQIRSPFQNITGYMPKYYAMLASAERLMEIESYQDDLKGERVPEKDVLDFYRNHFKALQLKNINFTYRKPDAAHSDVTVPQVLKDVNVLINKREYVALTGPSGCGKSTILKILMCLYPIDSGEKLIIGSDGEQELTSGWRALYAYVPQGNQLMSGTIREIITFNAKDSDESDIWEALRISCADDFVRELPEVLDTRLGEGGAGLSEGQMQRIAIARAVYSDHPVLLLDESTSSLDEKTELEVLARIRNMTDKTVIIVTHRPAALDICDKRIQFSTENVEVRSI